MFSAALSIYHINFIFITFIMNYYRNYSVSIRYYFRLYWIIIVEKNLRNHNWFANVIISILCAYHKSCMQRMKPCLPFFSFLKLYYFIHACYALHFPWTFWWFKRCILINHRCIVNGSLIPINRLSMKLCNRSCTVQMCCHKMW